jgi:5'-nucleotidase
MHQGGQQGTTASPGGAFDINGCVDMQASFADLVTQMSDDIDVVVSGHSHMAYNCTIDGKLVTSAASAGRLVTDLDLRIRRSDGEVVSKTARNIVVTRERRDGRETELLARYKPLGDKVGNRVVGSIAASLTRTDTEAGEFALGNVIADAFLDAAQRTPGANADLAIWNPGGIRADLVTQPDRREPTPFTYAQFFSVTPFGNELIVKTVTGETLVNMLEAQFGAERRRIMQVSRGFTYSYDPSRGPGRRVDRNSIRLNGMPLDPMRKYRLATSNFLWDGGDGMSALAAGTDALLIGTDYDLLAEYFSRHSPVQSGARDRIRITR